MHRPTKQRSLRWTATAMLLVVLAAGCPQPPGENPDDAPQDADEFRGSAPFAAIPLSGTAPLTVDLTGLISNEVLEAPWWTFGDGATVGQMNPQHTYEAPGEYSVARTIETAHGLYRTRREYLITAREPIGATLSSTARLLSRDPSLSVLRVDAAELVLAQADVGGALPVNDDIVMADGQWPFLRRVTSIQVDGAQVTLQTAPASLADMLATGDAAVRMRFTAEDFLAAGFAVDGEGRGMLDIPGAWLSPGGEATVAGHITFDCDAALDIRMDNGTAFFSASILQHAAPRLNVRINFASARNIDQSIDILSQLVGISEPVHRAWAEIGAARLLVEMRLRLRAGIVAQAPGAAGAATRIEGTLDTWAAADYRLGEWRTFSEAAVDIQPVEPDWNMDAGFGGEIWIEPRVDFTIHEYAGPAMATVAYARFERPDDQAEQQPSRAALRAGVDVMLDLSEDALTPLDPQLASSGQRYDIEGPSTIVWTEAGPDESGDGEEGASTTVLEGTWVDPDTAEFFRFDTDRFDYGVATGEGEDRLRVAASGSFGFPDGETAQHVDLQVETVVLPGTNLEVGQQLPALFALTEETGDGVVVEALYLHVGWQGVRPDGFEGSNSPYYRLAVLDTL